MSETYVRCIVVSTETEVPDMALIQIHDDLPPVHYVPLDDLIELTERTVWRGNPEWPAKFWSSEPVPVDVGEA